MLSSINEWYRGFLENLDWWVIFGLVGQLMFTMRFVVQWIVSEKKGKSTIPTVFWYFSLSGGMVLFIYAIQIKNLVFMIGQGAGLIIYVRNLMLISKHKKQKKASFESEV